MCRHVATGDVYCRVRGYVLRSVNERDCFHFKHKNEDVLRETPPGMEWRQHTRESGSVVHELVAEGVRDHPRLFLAHVQETGPVGWRFSVMVGRYYTLEGDAATLEDAKSAVIEILSMTGSPASVLRVECLDPDTVEVRHPDVKVVVHIPDGEVGYVTVENRREGGSRRSYPVYLCPPGEDMK
jgi:hypothetical protein